LVVDNLRQNYIHQLTIDGVRATERSHSLVHPIAYYTLNNIPEGQKLALSETSTRSSAPAAPAKKGATPAIKTGATGKALPKGKLVASAAAPTYDEVKGLLARHTCLACHNTENRQVGPAYRAVAKRNYTNDQIVDLIYNPKPQNWPDYSTEMPPMPQVPKADALKIAAWINSLSKADGAKAVDKP